jgi:hypothetical protein
MKIEVQLFHNYSYWLKNGIWYRYMGYQCSSSYIDQRHWNYHCMGFFLQVRCCGRDCSELISRFLFMFARKLRSWFAEHWEERRRSPRLNGAKQLKSISFIEVHIPPVCRFEIGKLAVAIAVDKRVLHQR